MNFSSHHRTAFTLVEILTVMIILSLMAGMVVTAVQGVTRSARESRTRNIIAAVDSVLMEQYQSYKYRAFSVEVPDTFNPTSRNPNTEVGFEVLASEAARVRLMMVRDMQRMEMPDRLSDIADAPAMLRAAVSPVAIDQATGLIRGARNDRSVRRTFPVNWYDGTASFANGGDNVPSKLAAYRDRFPTGFNFNDPTAIANQGAECLFLIMSTSFVGGSPAIDAIPTSNIGDTDEDGLSEILDGWGQPLGFVRWPIGYFDFEQSIDTTVPDDFDLFRSDYTFHVDTSVSTVAVPTDINQGPAVKVNPWSMRPLVVSAGADGEFGLATNPWTAGGVEVTTFSYQDPSWYWPVNTNWYGRETPGRDRGVGNRTYNQHPYPDPYARRFIEANSGGMGFTGVLPGQVLASGSAATELTDNLSNYQLQAVQR